tara:strand:- start:683 stop:976 length:294 start_codon:yes stop_codon:yes gene_type:complete
VGEESGGNLIARNLKREGNLIARNLKERVNPKSKLYPSIIFHKSFCYYLNIIPNLIEMNYHDLDDMNIRHPKCFLATIIIGISAEIIFVAYYIYMNQ